MHALFVIYLVEPRPRVTFYLPRALDRGSARISLGSALPQPYRSAPTGVPVPHHASVVVLWIPDWTGDSVHTKAGPFQD